MVDFAKKLGFFIIIYLCLGMESDCYFFCFNNVKREYYFLFYLKRCFCQE